MSTATEQRYAAAALALVSLIWGYNFVMMQNRPRLRESISIRVAGLALHERLSQWQFLAVVNLLFGLLILIQPWNLASVLVVSLNRHVLACGRRLCEKSAEKNKHLDFDCLAPR